MFLGQYASTGSGNGLAPFRRQAIIWTSVHPFHRRIYAELGGDELTQYPLGDVALISNV